MTYRGSSPLLAGRVSSLHLDYGADTHTCGQDTVEVSELGLKIRTRWQFKLGTQLSVALVNPHPGHRPGRIAAEGIVVWCEQMPSDPDGAKMYESTVLFLELPDDLKQSLRDFSCR